MIRKCAGIIATVCVNILLIISNTKGYKVDSTGIDILLSDLYFI
jgi:hypothetical protein